MKELEAFDRSSYEAIDIDRLVVYTMVRLAEAGVDLSLENIVVGAFRMFPQKFSLLGYPQYPDATRVEKSLWRSKGKSRQWISGRTAYGYMITDRSRDIAEQTDAQLFDRAVRKKRPGSRVRRKEGILRETRESSAYAKFASGNAASISLGELCYLLQGTLDSSNDVLRSNFASLRTIVKDMRQQDLFDFLLVLEQRFPDILADKRR